MDGLRGASKSSDACWHKGCCTSSSQCDDGDLCTKDACSGNVCKHTAIAGCCTSTGASDGFDAGSPDAEGVGDKGDAGVGDRGPSIVQDSAALDAWALPPARADSDGLTGGCAVTPSAGGAGPSAGVLLCLLLLVRCCRRRG